MKPTHFGHTAWKTIAFDLETISDPAAIADLPQLEADSRLKDPVKIREDIARKEAERASKLGLNPWTARIAVFGWRTDDAAGHLILDESNERGFLADIWTTLAEHDRFITFNGNGFDVPVLMARSLILDVQPSVTISTAKYRIVNHVDLRMLLQNWDSHAPGKFDFFCKRILGRTPKGDMDGSMVQAAWDAGEAERIAAYCDQDVAATYDLYQRLVDIGWPGL